MEINPLVIVAILLLVAYTFLYAYTPGGQARNLLVVFVLLIIGYTLVLAVSELPLFGSSEAPAYNEVALRYIAGAARETGALNIVAAIITDYRAFDTLGEATVLFTAVAATLANLIAQRGSNKG